MKEVIKKLNKKYKLGIVSSNSKENIEKFVELNNLMSCFDFVLNYSLFFGKSKVFKKIMRKNKLEKNELVYIGDEVRDIIAAKKAGIGIIAVVWGMNNKIILKRKKPSFIADKPSEISKFLEKTIKKI